MEGQPLPSIYERGAALGGVSLNRLLNPSWKDSLLLPLGNYCSSLTFQTSLLTFNIELYSLVQMHTPSDLGYDPIILHIHEIFMDHSPSGPVNLLDPSRTSPMKTSESFPNSEIGLSLYEYYSPDHYGYPRDIPDPIQDSEQHSVSLLTFHIY